MPLVVVSVGRLAMLIIPVLRVVDIPAAPPPAAVLLFRNVIL
jgi:hypothetical protein